MIDKSKHEITKFMTEKQYNKVVSNFRFKDAEEYRLEPSRGTEASINYIYEVSLNKNKIHWDNIIQVGVAVYQMAKLRMLEFHYDFLDKFIDRKDYQLLYTDTDCLIASYAAEHIEDIVKPELKEEFEKEKYNYLPVESEEIGKKLNIQNGNLTNCDAICNGLRTPIIDNRTPGLFKLESWAHKGVFECSKLYFMDNNLSNNKEYKQKYEAQQELLKECHGKHNPLLIPINQILRKAENHFSSKGVNKNTNKDLLNIDTYQNVLETGKPQNAINRGLRYDDKAQSMISYEQTKRGLTPVYIKKIVDNDGITCRPIMV